MNMHLYRLPAVRQQILKQYFELDNPPPLETEVEVQMDATVPTYLSRRPVNVSNMQTQLSRKPLSSAR